MGLRKQAALLAVILTATIAGRAQTPSGKHTITVTFTYDFRLTPACSKKVKKNCVMKFNLYDLSAGYKNRTKLFSIPVGEVREAGAKAAGVKEFSGDSPLLLFESGRHLLGITAQTPGNVESDLRTCVSCKTWVEIPPPE